MRENRTSGTVRGVPGNRHSYRGGKNGDMVQMNLQQTLLTKKFYQLLSKVLLSILFIGCYFSSSAFALEPLVADVIKEQGLQVNGQPSKTDLRLPKQIVGAQWGLTNDACKNSGYDLIPYAGQNVTSIRYNLVNKYPGRRLTLIVIEKNHRCICSYVVDSDLIPGIFAVNHPYIKSLIIGPGR